MHHVEKLQRLATRMMKGFYGLSYEERLESLIYSLYPTDIAFGDLILAYRIRHQKVGTNQSDFFNVSLCDGRRMQMVNATFMPSLGVALLLNHMSAEVREIAYLSECQTKLNSISRIILRFFNLF